METNPYLVGYQVICSSACADAIPQINQSFFATKKEALDYATEWREHYDMIRKEIVPPQVNYNFTVEFYRVCVYDALDTKSGKVGIYLTTEEKMKSE